jgi:hypothetical protein
MEIEEGRKREEIEERFGKDVDKLLCPRVFLTLSIFTPFFKYSVAAVCLRVWG